MAWETTKSGKRRFVVKQRIGNKITSTAFRSEEEAGPLLDRIDTKRKLQRLINQEALDCEKQVIDLDKTVKKILEQTLICQGYMHRRSGWHRVSRLNKPLTPAEREYIRQVKKNAQPFALPTHSPEPEACATFF